MNDPSKQPVVAVKFQLPGGGFIEREWTMDDPDLSRASQSLNAPPDWLVNPQRDWPTPGGPIVMTGMIRPGFERAAHALVHNDPLQPVATEESELAT